MKKMIKGIAELAGIALVLAGIVVGMCETADADKQVMTMGIGLLMIAAGAVISILANRGEKNEFPG